MYHLWWGLLLVFCLSSCAPEFTRSLPGRSELNAPAEVILISVSGRCGPLCPATQNWAYLSEDGANDQLSRVFLATGLRTKVLSYAASPADLYRSPHSAFQQYGAQQLWRDMAELHRLWPQARWVLLGHSHGSVVLHQLLRSFPDQQIELLIDLDTQCLAWKHDLGASPLLRSGCDKAVAGRQHSNQANITPWNVRYNLEVLSSDKDWQWSQGRFVYSPLRDSLPNLRPDGSRQGIFSYRAQDDTHVIMPRRGSETMNWVTRAVQQIVQAERWRPKL